MKLLFHSNQACYRGTSQSLIKYAKYCRDIWGFDVWLSYCKNNQWNRPQAIDWWEREFPDKNFVYENFDEVNDFIKNNHIDINYSVKGGEVDNKLANNCKVCTHVVFRNYQPHGDVYAYISKWLSDVMTNGTRPWVDYPVILDDTKEDLRDYLGIPANAIVIGRHGGYEEYNLPWVHQIVYSIAQQRPDIYFIYLNTKRFCPPIKNIIHIEGTTNLVEITKFLNTCTLALQARDMGESFGVANAECMSLDKPVFAYRGTAGDQNQSIMIGDDYYLYDNPQDLINKLNRYLSSGIVEQPGYFSSKVATYSIENIMENQFGPVFLDRKPYAHKIKSLPAKESIS